MIENFLQWAAKQKIDNSASFLKWTAALNFGLLSAGQAVVLSQSKEIPKEQKNYLVAQEVSEGIINIGVYLAVAHLFQQAGEYLVDKMIVYPKKLFDNNIGNAKKFLDANLDTIKKNLISSSNDAEVLKKLKGYASFRTGWGVATGLLGTVIALNVFTPIIRNKVASFWQNKQKAVFKPEEVSNMQDFYFNAIYAKNLLNKNNSPLKFQADKLPLNKPIISYSSNKLSI